MNYIDLLIEDCVWFGEIRVQTGMMSRRKFICAGYLIIPTGLCNFDTSENSYGISLIRPYYMGILHEGNF